MARSLHFSSYLAVLLWSFLALGQAGPNTLAANHHNQRSQSTNGTWFILPIAKSKVQTAIKKYLLGPVPRHDKTLFPNGFPKDAHPILLYSAYGNDIRRGNLEIDALKSAAVQVPYVDRLGDGTPFLYPIANFLGGANGQDLMGVVPAVVGSVNANLIQLAHIMPYDAGYSAIGPDEYTTQVKKVTVPNPISGPGIVPSAIDFDFFTAKNPKYPLRTYRKMSNQPLILEENAMGQCQNNVIYFNETFTNPIMRTGKVTLYPGALPSSISGVYEGVQGVSANGELLGFKNQGCRDAAKAIGRESKQ